MIRFFWKGDDEEGEKKPSLWEELEVKKGKGFLMSHAGKKSAQNEGEEKREPGSR